MTESQPDEGADVIVGTPQCEKCGFFHVDECGKTPTNKTTSNTTNKEPQKLSLLEEHYQSFIGKIKGFDVLQKKVINLKQLARRLMANVQERKYTAKINHEIIQDYKNKHFEEFRESLKKALEKYPKQEAVKCQKTGKIQ